MYSSISSFYSAPTNEANTTQVSKYLVQELRKEPFFKDYNSASFDCMGRDEILQVFNDILTSLDPAQHAQIIHEDPTDTINRIMEFLRVLKYRPSLEDHVKYREGIQNGRADIICPIMAWILEKRDTLKTRAYLANFLVEIEIPNELLNDGDIQDTRQKYLNLIEEFKSVHKQREKLKIGQSTCGLVNDMQNIEHDLDCIRRRIEIARSKYTGYSDLPSLLRQARWNRKAREKSEELAKQAQFEEQKFRDGENKVRQSRRILKDLRDKNGTRTAEGIVEGLEENCEVLRYIVMEKIPHEMEVNERCITAMKLIENDPPNSQQELMELKMRAQMMRNEVHSLESLKFRKIHDGDLQHLNEEAEQTEKVRLLKASKLESIRRDLMIQRKLYDERNMERTCRLRVDNSVILTDEQYRSYMKQMRLKAGRYKQMRGELVRMQNEVGILSTTKFILDGELKDTADNLAAIETRLGIVGFSEAQEKLEELSSGKKILDETKRTNLFEMSCLSKDLHDTIALKKLHLEPLLKELQARRLEFQLLEADHKKLKDHYQSISTASELDALQYQQKISQLAKEYERLNLQYARTLAEISIAKTKLKQAEEESKIETLFGKEKTRGFKDKLLTKILEEERKSKLLKEENEENDHVCAQRKRQGELWTNLSTILKAKVNVRRDTADSY